jgi:FkbM family methyltransferase
MPNPSLLDTEHPVYDIELLRLLRGRRLSTRLRVLCVIGAHRLDELPLINRVFPALRRIYVFEPLAGPLVVLQQLARVDSRIRVFPVAVSDRDGTAQFHVTSNDGESSSLLGFGSHSKLFPEVEVQRTIEVPTRRLDSVIAEHALEPPDMLLIDVQGAEYQVLKSLPRSLLATVRLIYSEVSTERVYESAGLLADVEALLASRFANLGYAPLRADVPVHGNAVFVARDDVDDALALTASERVRLAYHRLRGRLRAKRVSATGAGASR